MSNDIDVEEQELKEMERQIMQAAEAEKEKAAQAEIAPSPDPVASPAPEAAPEPEAVVTPTPSTPAPQAPAEDDPVEWAKKKGLRSTEDIARALQAKEKEFHKRNQAGHPGYQDIQPPTPPPPPQPPVQSWMPQPEAPRYQVPPYNGYMPAPTRQQIIEEEAKKYRMDPEDLERLLPLLADVVDSRMSKKLTPLERSLEESNRTAARNAEMFELSQDPAFKDNRVQQELHAILDSDPSIFQRHAKPFTYAYEKALANLQRKTLQQGTVPETTPRPPVTAGGGNGSANTAPIRITPEIFESWSDKEQDAYVKSNGRIVPKR